MSGIALGAAYAAVQLVHQAHSKVKTSKARCARLVERCQFVIDRLERIAATRGGDAIIKERINELERCVQTAFLHYHFRTTKIDFEMTTNVQGFRTNCVDHSPSWPAGCHRILAASRSQCTANRGMQ